MDTEIDLRAILLPIVRRYRLVLGAAALAALAAALVSFLQSPVYQAAAVVLVTRPQFQLQFDPRFQTLPAEQIRPYKAYAALVKSPDLARQVLEKHREAFPGGQMTAEDLLAKVEASQRDDPSMIQIAVKDVDRDRAARLANSWAELYVQYANDLYRPQAEAEKNLEGQLKTADQELKAAEDALIAFQKQNDAVVLNQRLQAKQDALKALIGTGEAVKTNVVSARVAADNRELQDLLGARNQLRLVVQDARSLADQIRRQGQSPATRSGLSVLLVELEALTAASKSPVQLQVPLDRLGAEGLGPAELVATLEGLTRSLAEKETALNQQIEAVSRRLLQLDGLGTTRLRPEESTGPSQVSGPVAEEVERLSQETLGLQQEIAEKTRALDRLTLTRDVARNAYVALANKLSEVRVAGQVAEGDIRVAFRAPVPERPVGSAKTLNVLFGLVAGLLVGILGALALEYLPGALQASSRTARLPEPALSSAVAERDL